MKGVYWLIVFIGCFDLWLECIVFGKFGKGDLK